VTETKAEWIGAGELRIPLFPDHSQPIGNDAYVFLIRLSSYDKFVAADAPHNVGSADHLLQEVGGFSDEVRANLMAFRIVNFLGPSRSTKRTEKGVPERCASHRACSAIMKKPRRL